MTKTKSGSTKFIVALVVMFLALAAHIPAWAQAKEYQAVESCKVYQAASEKSPVIGKLDRGDIVYVRAIQGKWAKVLGADKAGYALKTALSPTGASSARDGGSALYRVQKKLSALGYVGEQAVTGKNNQDTQKGVRIFQMMNGLGVSGKLNQDTQAKILSGSAKKRKAVNGMPWSKSGIDGKFRDGGLAVVIDLATGKRIKIRRVGGHNHLDVEPKTAKDTALLKKVYGGNWSWDSRPILLIAGGTYYAAAMNGMPHGTGISKTNRFDGQFCIHLKGSLTHGTKRLNSYHQANIKKVIDYFG